MTSVMAVPIPPPGRGKRSNLLYHPDYIINNESAEKFTRYEIVKLIHADIKMMTQMLSLYYFYWKHWRTE